MKLEDAFVKTSMKLAVQGYAITREREYIKGFIGSSLFHPQSKRNVYECVYIAICRLWK